MSTCSIEGCDTKVFARTWCHKHWNLMDRHGSLSIVNKPGPLTKTDPCVDCGRSDRSVSLFRSTGDLVCSTCRSARGRREQGIPEMGAPWTPEIQRKYARDWAREAHAKRRVRVIEGYGGRCVCCGTAELVFLVIDHIDGGGNAHRRTLTKSGEIAGSSNFYKWLEKNGLPEGFQVLCHNCNFAKSHGGCPHVHASVC